MNILVPTKPTAAPSRASRIASGAGGAFFLAFGVFEMVKHGGATWATGLTGLIGPDIPMLFGAWGKDVAPKQLSPKVVPYHNALHHWVPPVLVMVAFSTLTETNTQAAPGFTLGAMWLAHVLIDKAFGFGLRNRAGFQRWQGNGEGL